MHETTLGPQPSLFLERRYPDSMDFSALESKTRDGNPLAPKPKGHSDGIDARKARFREVFLTIRLIAGAKRSTNTAMVTLLACPAVS